MIRLRHISPLHDESLGKSLAVLAHDDLSWRCHDMLMEQLIWRDDGVNTSRPRQNCRHFADDIFKCIFLNVNVCVSLKISLDFVPEVRIDNIPELVRRPGDTSLSEPMMANFLTHIYITRPQWVNSRNADLFSRNLNMFAFSTVSQYQYRGGHLYASPIKYISRSPSIANTMAADGLTTQRARV